MSSETIESDTPPAGCCRRIVRCLLGSIFLLASLTAAIVLAIQYLGHLELPGCGPGSGCAKAMNSYWRNLFDWPISFLGTAYFLSLLVVWLWVGRCEGISKWLKWGVRLGVCGSVFFIGLMVVEGHYCPYCLTVHGGNIAFWIVIECTRRLPEAAFLRPAIAGVIVFAAVTAVLAVLQQHAADVGAERSCRNRSPESSNLSAIPGRFHRVTAGRHPLSRRNRTISATTVRLGVAPEPQGDLGDGQPIMV